MISNLGFGGVKKISSKEPPFTFPNGAVYEGEWFNGLRCGYGVQDWKDGARYEGLYIINNNDQLFFRGMEE